MDYSKFTKNEKSNSNQNPIAVFADLLPEFKIRWILIAGGVVGVIYLGGKFFRLLGHFNQDFNYFKSTIK